MIFIAVANGDMVALQNFIKQGTDIATTVFTSNASALQVACQYEQFDVVELLLKQKAYVNYQVGVLRFFLFFLSLTRIFVCNHCQKYLGHLVSSMVHFLHNRCLYNLLPYHLFFQTHLSAGYTGIAFSSVKYSKIASKELCI